MVVCGEYGGVMSADDDRSSARVVVGDSLNGDFEQFFAESAGRTRAVAYALTGNWADAEDLVQDAYAAALRAWSRVVQYDDPAGWVCRVVTNRSVSRWRRLGREARALLRLGARPGPGDPALADPTFWRAVQALPVRQREVVALFYVADLPVADVAQRLGCSEGTVKSHLSRARRTLHESLRVEEDDHA